MRRQHSLCTLEVEWVSSGEHYRVELGDFARANTLQWRTLYWDGSPPEDMAAHEYGHMLGFADDFSVPGCPVPMSKNRSSIMGDSSAPVPSLILDQICRENRTVADGGFSPPGQLRFTWANVTGNDIDDSTGTTLRDTFLKKYCVSTNVQYRGGTTPDHLCFCFTQESNGAHDNAKTLPIPNLSPTDPDARKKYIRSIGRILGDQQKISLVFIDKQMG